LPSGHKKLITFGSPSRSRRPDGERLRPAILAAPFILWQLYAYILPLQPGREAGGAAILLLFPILFVAGVAFSYFAVMPAALHFLLGFNETSSTSR